MTSSGACRRGRGRGPTSSSCSVPRRSGAPSRRASPRPGSCSCDSALAAADWMSLRRRRAPLCGSTSSSAMASTYGLRRTLSATRRIFVADTPLEGNARPVPRGDLPRAAAPSATGLPRSARRVCASFVFRVAHFFTTFLSEPECPRKIRVGANSPSLWPTRFSVT